MGPSVFIATSKGPKGIQSFCSKKDGSLTHKVNEGVGPIDGFFLNVGLGENRGSKGENKIKSNPLLLSFDDHCHKPRNYKKVRKKMRDIIDIGEKVEDHVYLVEAFYLLKQDQIRTNSGTVHGHLKSNFALGDIPVSSDSLTHYDVRNLRNCNSRVVKGVPRKALEGLWNSMNKLGISLTSNAFEPILRL